VIGRNRILASAVDIFANAT